MVVRTVYRVSCLSTLVALTLVLVFQMSVAEEQAPSTVKSPLRLSKDLISGIGIEDVPWEDESRTAKWSYFFRGEELSVSVFESTPVGRANQSSPSRARVTDYPYDQFVLVLSGKSVLIDSAGNSQTFSAGDFFVVPKGFSGIWEEHGVYRELIVIDEEAVRTRPLEIEALD